MIKDFLWTTVILITLFFLSITAFGTEIKEATDLTDTMLIFLPDGTNPEYMTDNDINTYVSPWFFRCDRFPSGRYQRNIH